MSESGSLNFSYGKHCDESASTTLQNNMLILYSNTDTSANSANAKLNWADFAQSLP